MNKSFQLYADEILPAGFHYPEVLRNLAKSGTYPDICPWFFDSANTEGGKLGFALRLSDGRNLIPFAHCSDDDNDTACFDGDDASGNPRILIKNSFDKFDYPGRRYAYADFDEWFQAAQAYAKRLRA